MKTTNYIVAICLLVLVSLPVLSNPIWRDAVVLSGNEYSGKTSLSNILRGEAFNDPEFSTEAVEVRRVENDVSKFLTIDFGGQPDFDHPTSYLLHHQRFILFAVKAREPDIEMRALQFIHQRAPNATIQVVCTQIDKIPIAKRASLMRDIHRDIERIAEVLKAHINPNAIVFSAKTREGIDEVRDVIDVHMRQQEKHSENIDKFIDALWNAGRTQHYMSRREAYRLALENGIAQDGILTALQACHQAGVCFISKNIPDFVVLDVQHFFKVLSRFFIPPPQIADEMEEPTLFTLDLAQKIWTPEKRGFGDKYSVEDLFKTEALEEMPLYFSWLSHIPIGIAMGNDKILITSELRLSPANIPAHFAFEPRWKDGSTAPFLGYMNNGFSNGRQAAPLSNLVMSDLFASLATQPGITIHASTRYLAEITEQQTGLRYLIASSELGRRLDVHIVDLDPRMNFHDVSQNITNSLQEPLSRLLPNVVFEKNYFVCAHCYKGLFSIDSLIRLREAEREQHREIGLQCLNCYKINLADELIRFHSLDIASPSVRQ